MAPILITKCKTKPFTGIGMILFGIGMLALPAWLIYSDGSWWWSILALFGIFCIYHWSNVLIQGSMTLVLFVDSGNLYVTYEPTKKVMSNLERIKSLEYYSNLFHLDKIERFWQYIVKTNGTVSSDILYFEYNKEKQVLADLDYFGAEIKKGDTEKIVHFLLSHNPYIRIGKV